MTSDRRPTTSLPSAEATLLDLVDRLLGKGVMATGDVTLGVAGVDLIYVRLSALLCAADRVLPAVQDQPARRRRRRISNRESLGRLLPASARPSRRR